MKRRVSRLTLYSAVFGIGAVLVGFGGMRTLLALKEEPAAVETNVTPLPVEVIEVAPENLIAVMDGHGEVRTRDTVTVAVEVAGRVDRVHPSLEVGEVVPEGEVLFEIDRRTYAAHAAEAEAAVDQAQSTIERLRAEYGEDRARLATLERSEDLARAEFERLRQLFEADQVGTRSAVDAAERNYNAARDQADLLRQALTVYPNRIKEAESALASAQARLDLARINLERTRLTAPFNARVKYVDLEVGQYVAPGTTVLTLADDSVLEIPVALDSRDAQQWMRFTSGAPAPGKAWFPTPEPVDAEIRWTEEMNGHRWRGRVDRVEQFDPDTRMLTVVVRVEGRGVWSQNGGGLPLVEGMFCQVTIPGKPLEAVYALPPWAVSFENQVRLARDGRLATVDVVVARAQDGLVYVRDGLRPGDRVIVNRLALPIEGAPVDSVTRTLEDLLS